MLRDVFLPVGAVVPPMESFLASDRFKRDMSTGVTVKINDVGANFQEWFGSLTVLAHKGSMLQYRTLACNANDTEIFDALGGKAKTETSLSEIWWLMTQQDRGQSGFLLNDGKANIFYAVDCNGVLRALSVYWYDYGWSVHAFELGFYWFGYGRVFVRSPRFESEAVEAGNSMQP